jgi:putative membrane protein
VPFLFRYQTLRYRFDEDGVHASWGFFFRREISLTYARIQDIHLHRGLLERWLGLGAVQIQTASGSGGADLVVEGVVDFDAVRDFLYAKMRGATTAKVAPTTTPALDAEAVALLRAIKDDVKAAREALEARRA